MNAKKAPAGPVGVPVARAALVFVILLVVVPCFKAFCVVCVWLVVLGLFVA